MSNILFDFSGPENRLTEMPICFLASDGRSILSNLIKWRTGGNYSHVAYVPRYMFDSYRAVMLSPVIHGPLVLEAWKGSVQITDFKKSHDPRTIVHMYAKMVPIEKICSVEEWLYRRLYKKYDYAAIIGFLLGRERELQDDKKWFCSELIADAFQRCGIIQYDDEPCITDPSRFVRLCEKQGFQRV